MSGNTLSHNAESKQAENTLRNFRIKRLHGVNIRFEWEADNGEKGHISYALDRDVQKFYLMDEGYTKSESSALLGAVFEKLNEICIVKETIKKSRRDEIIESMCYTLRHDFGLTKSENAGMLSSGLTEKERQALWINMAQIYDNVIVPQILKNENC